MKIENRYNREFCIPKSKVDNIHYYNFEQLKDKLELNLIKISNSPNFTGNPIKELKDFFRYIKVQRYINGLVPYIKTRPNHENFLFRNLSMEYMEGIQYGIKVFKGLTMKDIQYLCENLHVIAVKRGCNNMCGYCYADAKPVKREMSWEDFTLITRGFKELRSRLKGLPIFGENLPLSKREPIYTTTEVFYDADCMDLAIKDKKGKVYDMRDLITEIYDSIGRKSCFDTSGWDPNNKTMQERAEKYVEYFSKPENIKKLNAFNLSFNTFNASYIAGVKALKAGDREKFLRLKDKFTDRIANAIFTFTPLFKYEEFGIITRCFGLKSRNSKHFDFLAISDLMANVMEKLENLYKTDFNGAQKYVKSPEDINKYSDLAFKKMQTVNTALNSSGRMKQFMETFGIKDNSMQNHTETTKIIYEDLMQNGRFNEIITGHKLIDADGKVYHMDYARFFPTEIQLNIKDKTSAPKLANLKEDCLIPKEVINRPEELHFISEFT